jgi:hypothetical protein
MKPWEAFSYFFGGLLILGGLCYLSAIAPGFFLLKHIVPDGAHRPPPEVALAIITGGALGIERAMEAMWTFVDYMFGSSWPLSLNKEIDKRVDAFKGISTLKDKMDKWNLPNKDQIKTALDDAIDALPKAEELAHMTNNQQLNALTTSLGGKWDTIVKDHPDLKEKIAADVDLAASLAHTSEDFLATFKANPGRKVISIYLGAIIGICVATVAGVNIFGATDTADAFRSGDFAVPLTGVIMGLGSNPTHEIVAALKQYKDSKKTPTST